MFERAGPPEVMPVDFDVVEGERGSCDARCVMVDGVLINGVYGCGKSTVAAEVADQPDDAAGRVLHRRIVRRLSRSQLTEWSGVAERSTDGPVPGV